MLLLAQKICAHTGKEMNFKNATIKVAIVLIPSYTVAFFTEQMVYVVPMLAATSFFAGTVDLNEKTTLRRVNEDNTDQGAEYDSETNFESATAQDAD